MLQVWYDVRFSATLIFTIRRAKWVIVQNKNKMVKPLDKALIILTAFAAVFGSLPKATIKILPNNTNKGAPGGCGICK